MKTKAHPSDKISEREQRNRQLAYEIATEGIVLLANNGALPLSPCPVALYGAGATRTITGGSGSGEVYVRHSITIEEGLEQAGFSITTKDWLRRYDALWTAGKEQFLSAARKKLWWPSERVFNDLMALEYRFPAGDLITEAEISADAADTCIYVLSRQSGEGHDLKDAAGSFRLNSTEEQNIRLCAKKYKRFILVINTGTPIDLSPLDAIDGIDAIVYMSQPGMESGRALAAILTGTCCPCGRLAVSWPKSYADVPFGEEFARDWNKAVYKEGIYVGYRYYDSFGVAPRYAFGYGLSYTRFSMGAMQARVERDEVHCSLRVTNTGECAGKEVVQVYVRCPGADREYQRLAAFSKTCLLSPGASEEMQLSFPLSALSCYDEQKAQTVLEEGAYLIQIGRSSRDTQPVAALQVKQRIVLSCHKNLCAAASPVAELHHANTFSLPAGIPVLPVQTETFSTRQIDYTPQPVQCSEHTRTFMSQLTAEQLLLFCAGTGMAGENRGFRTPGAVGHTTAAFSERGIPNVEMCDGPAGVRLDKRAVLYPNGTIRAVDISLSVYEFLPRLLLRWFILGDPKKGQLLYQYVTGYPIEAMVAQTWNIPLVEQMGRAVSEDMHAYGVTYWLAPAMNIVRNPLCGRNYEYYSEDPLLTGLMATAVTRGVQSRKGTFATVKHYCANNQETNRFAVSSEMDERVLREIYCKGFEMVITQARPQAVMAAYNKVNGVYCPNSYALCTELLRQEWGFQGIVMTDWFSTGPERADEAQAIRAGVDLLMPGNKNTNKALQTAYRDGRLAATDLLRAAGRVLDAIQQTL